MQPDRLSAVNPFIRLAKYDVVDTPWVMAERVIFDYELLYIKEGCLHITIEAQRFDSQPGEVYLFRPGQPHSITVLEEGFVIQPHMHFDIFQYDDYNDVYINFKNLHAMSGEERSHIRPDEIARLFPNFPSRMRLNDPRYVEFLFFDVIQNFYSKNKYREIALKWSFLKLFGYLLEEITYLDGGARNKKRMLAEQIQMYLENNLERNVSMEELARLFHMDGSYLGRVFRDAYNIPPIKYHHMLRIKKSKELLQFTNASVTAVAQRMGFDSINDFSRAFKREEGCSPINVRK